MEESLYGVPSMGLRKVDIILPGQWSKPFKKGLASPIPNSYGLLFQRMASKLSSWRCSKRRTKQITKHDKQVVKTSGKGLSHFDAAGFFVMYAKFCGC